MSWMKRPQGPRPEGQPYSAAQPYGNQQSMYPNYQGTPAAAQQQQTWQQQQQPQYNQQYSQVYQTQPFVSSSNQMFQQQQYNQNYTNQNQNQNFDNIQGYQPNYFHNQAPQQPKFTQNESSDTWEDNWDWGWDEASKQQSAASQVSQQAAQAHTLNNANVIEESFASTQSWNWSMEDQKEKEQQQVPVQNIQSHNQSVNSDNTNAANVINHNIGISEPSSQHRVSDVPSQGNSNEVKNLSDKEVVKEHLPNLALGKRFNLENLTPQWSIESQMSQDSSDGPLTQSEGTYRSENQSRNSSKSSPGPNTDTSNFNYSLSGFNEMSVTNTEISKHTDDSTSSNTHNNRRENYDELANSVQEMSIANNENQANAAANVSVRSSETLRENQQPILPPLPSVSPSMSNQYIHQPTMVAPPSSHMPQTSSIAANPLPNNAGPPAQVLPSNLPPPPSSMITSSNMPTSLSSMSHPPPTSFPTSTQNPFKSASPFSHKNIPKIPTQSQPQSFPPQVPNSNLASPAVITQILQQDRLSTSFGANLETTPDNSERPDQPQMTNYRSIPISHQVPDNLEVAPQNDRNEYLQTAHLSSSDYGENTDFSRNIPPPGLRRMGVGQQEAEYNQGLNVSGDEPPPGLARMVPGQQTEVDNSYNRVGDDDYMDRRIDGQPMDDGGRPYRRADGQQTPDYAQASTNRSGDRRPIGLDRMVPGEPSNEEYIQYQTSSFVGANEHRVVTGVDHDYPVATDAGPSDVREQNVDGSDYTEPTPRNPSRSIIGVRDASNATSPDFSLSVDDQQREITMEGENLQDLSSVSAVDVPFARDPPYEGSTSNVAEAPRDRSHDAADAAEYPTSNSRRQSVNCITSGEDSGRDRAYKASPRKDREKSKPKDRERDRDRDRDRDKDRGRYSRGDRKYDRESERRPGRDERRSEAARGWERERRHRDESPDARRHRRSTRSHRYETEDTDYYSDRERDRRQHREGSYTSSKPPRDDKGRRYDERERGERRRHNTMERDRRYDDERTRRSERPADAARRERDRERDRFEHRYRDIDPNKYASLRRHKEYKDDDERRKVVTFSGEANSGRSGRSGSKAEGEAYSSGSRAGSREATATDEEAEEPRRRAPREQRRRHRYHHYYKGYEAGAGAGAGGAAWDEAMEAQRRQYEYYERLRRTDPAAYMRIYKQLLAPGLYGHAPYADAAGYATLGYEARAEERGSVHSGRSSANGLKPTDTELTTDMSLNLHLEESTVRSERMTPFKYSTAHVKGALSARALLVVRAGYPVDGRAPALSVLPLAQLLQRDPQAAELAAYPGPLIKGVTHKKSVVEYCERRARDSAGGGPDAPGHALLWDLLALLLRQNGVVVGSDLAELLMKNAKEFQYDSAPAASNESGGSPQPAARAAEGEAGEREARSPPLPCPLPDDTLVEEEEEKPDERQALDRFRELLIYGNRQEALEWAMRRGLWAHALALAAHGERRARAAVSARFVASLCAADPLHSLYTALALRAPPAARWRDWRPHAAILLANPSARPDHDTRALTQLGDSLSARGLPWSAQFCYLSAGVPFAPHPLAPLQRARAAAAPRLALLLADPRADSLPRLATNRAIFATEIYEYALSLGQDFALPELAPYKLALGARLADCGQPERALGYAEAAARAVAREPARHSAALAAAVARLAERLKYCDPALQDDAADDAPDAPDEESPRHQQWLRDVHALAQRLEAEASQQSTPQHEAQPTGDAGDQYGWAEQTVQQQQYAAPQQQYAAPQPVAQQYADPVADAADYAHYPPPQDAPAYQPYEAPEYQPEQHYAGYDEPQQHYEPYWQHDSQYAYREPAPPPRAAAPPPGLRRRLAAPRPAPPPAPPPAAPPHRARRATPPALPRTETWRERSTPDAEVPDRRPCAVAPDSQRRPAAPAPQTVPSPIRAQKTDLEVHDSATLPENRHNSRENNPFLDISPDRHPVARGTPLIQRARFRSSCDRESLRSCDSCGSRVRAGAPSGDALVPRRRCTSRYGTVVGDTVESWARAAAQQRANRPLVFGGTYPIDEPTRALGPGDSPADEATSERKPEPSPPPSRESVHTPKPRTESADRGAGSSTELIIDPEAHRRKLRETIEQSVEKFEAMLALKGIGGLKREKSVLTFAIDEPLDPWGDEDALPKDDDVRYFVTSHKTFDIDEPVSI
ncbi:uncharacterized protein LOC112049178 isoform X2 [Bicyclus anynana]|uniref:Uncharacterized protein LOC112049178 isoform X2 n=1 Tax=Bicyclus anynana TaxID=110368 RepID=A0ABM3LE71_BICAN|nr:uncharacterized protein LOC112049178 isoform X2 [Bicyclus anynana]